MAQSGGRPVTPPNTVYRCHHCGGHSPVTPAVVAVPVMKEVLCHHCGRKSFVVCLPDGKKPTACMNCRGGGRLTAWAPTPDGKPVDGFTILYLCGECLREEQGDTPLAVARRGIP